MPTPAQTFDALVAAHYPQLSHLLELPAYNKAKLVYFLEQDQLPDGDYLGRHWVAKLPEETCETIITKHQVAADLIKRLRDR